MTRTFSVVAAAFLLLSVTGVAPASAKQDYRLGNNSVGSRFDLVAKAGIGWMQADFTQGEIERQPGQYDWTRQDKLVADAAEHGVKISPVLWQGYQQNHAPATDEERDNFARFAYEAASHFKGRIDTWEIWNEPNIGGFWNPNRNPRDYALLLKAAYTAIKAANPSAVVLGGSTADIVDTTDPDFIREICRNGAADYMDVLSIHPYRYGENPEIKFAEPIQELRDIMAEYGKPDIPIWITEIGWHTPGRGQSQADQADIYVRSYLTSLAAGVKKYMWYYFFGLLDNFSMAFDEGAQMIEKSVIRASGACADVIADGELVGVMPWQDPLYGVVFRRPNDVVVAAWRRYGTEAAPLPVALQVIDQYGRPGAKPVLSTAVHYFILPADSPVVGQVVPRFPEGQMGGTPPPVKWTHHVEWTYQDRDGWYSSPAVGDVNGDGQKEVVVASGDEKALICFAADGRELWRVKSENPILSSPALADLNGDGRLEVVAGTNGRAYAPSMDVVVGGEGRLEVAGTNELPKGEVWAVNGAGETIWSTPLEASVDDSAPTAADLDGDGSPEVIIGAGSIIYCFDAQGKERWRYTMTNLRGLKEEPKCGGPVAVGDVDGDGKPNVLIPATDGSLRCLEGDGHEIWRAMETDEPCRTGPVIGDLDGDGQPEILTVLDARSLYCLAGVDGRELWRVPLGGRVYTSIALGDINGDGKIEIVLGDYTERLYCFSNDGKLLWQWNAFGKIKSAPVLADVDGDKRIEVLVGDREGWFSCLDDQGKLKWRFTTANDEEITESAAVADMDGDGKLEAVFGCKQGDLECLSLGGGPDPKLMPWPSRRQDPSGRAILGR